MKNNFCIGCGAPGVKISYCSECVAKLRQIRYQVQAIMAQAKLPPADGQTCVDCGKRAFHYDHRYYSRPLDVVPVCRQCNQRRGPPRDLADVIRNGLGYQPSFAPETVAPDAAGALVSLPSELQSAERQAIERALANANWNRTKAAKLLGISFRQIRYKIKKFGIGHAPGI